ncbi:MAG: hypothetical protein JXB50_05010 [Spirochaetes bacterium]|nr:hypothetical protein [Spirochaetota bacterium]
MIKKLFFILLSLFFSVFYFISEDWIVSKKDSYYRITDCVIVDVDYDGIDEVAIAHFRKTDRKKYVDIFKVTDGNLILIDQIAVPYYTVFFDIGDIDNDKKCDIVFLSSEGLYFKEITVGVKNNRNSLRFIENIKSEIVVPQPELLTDVRMIIDLDSDGKNEFIFENIRSIEIYETLNFRKIASIRLDTVLEYALIPGQFYPHYIFYTLPIIQLNDLDGDKKLEVITKFPRTINVYGFSTLAEWSLKSSMNVVKDNVYFLSDAYIKFAFPVIVDIDNDDIKEVVISSANLDMPRLRFEAIGDVYFFNKNSLKINKSKKIIVKGIPLNLPYFFNITDKKIKDFIIPVIPFNLLTVFTLLSGSGSAKVPFMLYTQTDESFEIKNPKKLFDIQVRLENITSFVEELPLDQYKPDSYPDFYYFVHDFKNATVDILYYYNNEKNNKYETESVKSLSIPSYRKELPATLKLAHLSKNIKKDVVYITHDTLFVLSRK